MQELRDPYILDWRRGIFASEELSRQNINGPWKGMGVDYHRKCHERPAGALRNGYRERYLSTNVPIGYERKDQTEPCLVARYFLR